MAWRLVVRPAAVRDMKRLQRDVLKRVAHALGLLADDPGPPDAIKLRGQQDLCRVRLGDYRIIYRIQDDETTVTVARVKHRREAYREL